MESICSEVLHLCLQGEPCPTGLLDRALEVNGGREFLSVVVERLGDLFEPRLCDIYADLFSQVVKRVAPEHTLRLRPPLMSRSVVPKAERVYVLSRVTLGADVAVTSVLLDAAKRKYPAAEIVFVGPRKSYELFETDSRLSYMAAPYARSGTLAERLKASADLWLVDGLVIDPDTRLTQLGSISVCPEQNYLWFPSRSYGGEGNESLPALAARWAEEVFGISGAKPYVAPRRSADVPAEVTVSLGVGENATKRRGDEFEHALIQLLVATGAGVIVDQGGDAEERGRVERSLVPGVRTHSGSFASFASLISQSKLYAGYDSAGGHVASACGIPLISIAKGFVSERMAARWRPNGTIIDGNAADVLEQIRAALSTYTFRR